MLFLALLYKNCIPYFLANAYPSLRETCRSESFTSDLLPMIILHIVSG